MQHSDLFPLWPATKAWKDAACLYLSSSESKALFDYFFPPQINSSVQCWRIKQAGICLRCESEEVLQMRNTVIRPPLELRMAPEAPRRRETAQGNLIRHNSSWLPHLNVELKESQQSSLRTLKIPEETKTSCLSGYASVALKQTLKRKSCQAANLPPWDEVKAL